MNSRYGEDIENLKTVEIGAEDLVDDLSLDGEDIGHTEWGWR